MSADAQGLAGPTHSSDSRATMATTGTSPATTTATATNTTASTLPPTSFLRDILGGDGGEAVSERLTYLNRLDSLSLHQLVTEDARLLERRQDLERGIRATTVKNYARFVEGVEAVKRTHEASQQLSASLETISSRLSQLGMECHMLRNVAGQAEIGDGGSGQTGSGVVLSMDEVRSLVARKDWDRAVRLCRRASHTDKKLHSALSDLVRGSLFRELTRTLHAGATFDLLKHMKALDSCSTTTSTTTTTTSTTTTTTSTTTATDNPSSQSAPSCQDDSMALPLTFLTARTLWLEARVRSVAQGNGVYALASADHSGTGLHAPEVNHALHTLFCTAGGTCSDAEHKRSAMSHGGGAGGCPGEVGGCFQHQPGSLKAVSSGSDAHRLCAEGSEGCAVGQSTHTGARSHVSSLMPDPSSPSINGTQGRLKALAHAVISVQASTKATDDTDTQKTSTEEPTGNTNSAATAEYQWQQTWASVASSARSCLRDTHTQFTVTFLPDEQSTDTSASHATDSKQPASALSTTTTPTQTQPHAAGIQRMLSQWLRGRLLRLTQLFAQTIAAVRRAHTLRLVFDQAMALSRALGPMGAGFGSMLQDAFSTRVHHMLCQVLRDSERAFVRQLLRVSERVDGDGSPTPAHQRQMTVLARMGPRASLVIARCFAKRVGSAVDADAVLREWQACIGAQGSDGGERKSSDDSSQQVQTFRPCLLWRAVVQSERSAMASLSLSLTRAEAGLLSFPSLVAYSSCLMRGLSQIKACVPRTAVVPLTAAVEDSLAWMGQLIASWPLLCTEFGGSALGSDTPSNDSKASSFSIDTGAAVDKSSSNEESTAGPSGMPSFPSVPPSHLLALARCARDTLVGWTQAVMGTIIQLPQGFPEHAQLKQATHTLTRVCRVLAEE